MAEYRRWYMPGGTCFFTVVTQDRVTIFRDSAGSSLARGHYVHGSEKIAISHPRDRFVSSATIYTAFSRYKGRFGLLWPLAVDQRSVHRAMAHGGSRRSNSRLRGCRKGEHGVWHYAQVLVSTRFGTKRILERHVDYIRYNPVKHEYAARPADWLSVELLPACRTRAVFTGLGHDRT